MRVGLGFIALWTLLLLGASTSVGAATELVHPKADTITNSSGTAVGATSVECAKLQSLLTPARSPSLLKMKADWAELRSFHEELWRAMALDPGTLPANEVPDALQSKNLSDKLEKKFEDLSNSVLIQKYGLEQPFAEYVDVVSQILSLRRELKFIPARALAKKGILDKAYSNLNQALIEGQQADEGVILPIMSNETEKKLKDVLNSMALTEAVHNPQIKEKIALAEGTAAPVAAPVHSQLGSRLDSLGSLHHVIAWMLYGVFLGFVLALPIGAFIQHKLSVKSAQRLGDQDVVSFSGATQAVPSQSVWLQGFDFTAWLKDFHALVVDYRKQRPESDAALKQVQPFLGDSSRLFSKYYKESRESFYRGKFTDLELQTSDLVTALSGSLNHSDEQCRALIQHLSLLANAIQSATRPAKSA
jgi:hypothetical protein